MPVEAGTLLQRVFLGLAGVVSRDAAAEMAADSRRWVWECRNCGHRRSIWELGGLRYRGSGTRRRLARCSECGAVDVHRFHRIDGPPPQGLLGHGPLRKGAAILFLILILVAVAIAAIWLPVLLIGGLL